ncbi:Cathepsin K like protein [Argiope bruennichi]|uniref:Cathepsin K like protein n=1 Tax=Argiope bruennichi TaxID=94029 RepID=A0A8T0FZH9_ARGBR|nr:Cathepsin K like protein [Argiope bruennichi]
MRGTTNNSFLTPVIFPALILICFTLYEVSTDTLNVDFDDYWELFKRTYCKVYRDADEEAQRRLLWETQVLECFLHNIRAHFGLLPFTRGCNAYSDLVRNKHFDFRYTHFADFHLFHVYENPISLPIFYSIIYTVADEIPLKSTDEEFNQHMKGYKNIDYQSNSSSWVGTSSLGAPSSIDHRNDGLVTGVKDQRMCGACWAFSAIGSLEGQQKKKSDNLVALSEQQLVECSTNDINDGCNGGLMTAAFEYIKRSQGVDTEKSYPYTASQGDCNFRPNHVGAKITGFVELPPGDEKALRDAVASVGPISVAIDAGPRSFRTYKSPDLNPCDFWLQGSHKGYVSNEANLKAIIVQNISFISNETFHAADDIAVVRF